jgi:putative DNA primase/helicase
MQEEQNVPFEQNPRVAAWMEVFESGLRCGSDLARMQIVPRAPLVGDWLKSGDLGFIFASRGIGKSWLSMYLAKGLATKTDVGPWKTHCQVRVLYLDGEMPAPDLKERSRLLGADESPHLVYGNYEIMSENPKATLMNLADLDFQTATLNICLAKNFNVLIADNLSTLVSGIDENKSLDWELILPWLLTLRRNHITVIIVHHAGRNKQMRGTSKREDPAFWILRLDEDSSADDQSGACFVSRFTKWRNATAFPETWRWHFKPLPSQNGTPDSLRVEYQAASPLFVFIQWVNAGLSTCTDIAIEMDVSKGYISRLAKKAISLGRIKMNGRNYLPFE